MDHTTAPLTTAGEILAAYKAVSDNPMLKSEANKTGLFADLARLLLSRPVEEIVGCSPRHITLVSVILEKEYDLARGSAAQAAVVAKGLSLVDAFVMAGEFGNANYWLDRGYRVCPNPSSTVRKPILKHFCQFPRFAAYRAGASSKCSAKFCWPIAIMPCI
jgi:hypothetical protein